MAGLEIILSNKPKQIGFFDIDWNVLVENMKGSGLYIFNDLIKNKIGSRNSMLDKQSEFLKEILSLERMDQYNIVVSFLKEELSKILKLSKNKIQTDKGIGFLGIDSILSVELLRVINNKFNIKMSSMELLTLPSVNQLANIIIEKILKSHKMELV